YGGLKAVERQLGIERRLKDMNGWEAVKLWWKYVDSFDLAALNKLLEYNREDVVNLRAVKARLLDCK
ncbi:MAG: ribonuclease H-like domain-containing protein, partial [Dehalococcoidales bacterium]|nr:ribonuclease H-like domain-containing protein [Dehalococcoidales bacterium]